MKKPHLLLIVTLGFCFVACSEKSGRENAKERRGESAEAEGKGNSQPEAGEEAERREAAAAPEPENIGEDCVAFLRSTKAVPLGHENKDCPSCPAPKAVEVLQFENFKIKRTSPSKESCSVEVEIKAKFNPSSGGKIFGGLIGWIPLEERDQYERGETPTGSRSYQVSVVYRRENGFWRAIEFAPTAH